ncbi:hypothetical protein F4821DRAFT_183967 [Hypoxylon rubiginosum]|uniref:Uncharacterized protein n=1 Tax=Hypoxylon rubiginosum TaxID=110542 RepID=A0ACC0CTH7_9PEZI|nr:hypothetical protein F4821DRAFT_183967 [Hypoxylon rubiginosum]
MGNSISAVLDESRGEDQETRQKTRQDLDVLQKAVDSKLNEFDHKLTDEFLNQAATSRSDVPGMRAVRKTRLTHVGVKGTPDEMVSGAIDSHFPIGSAGIDSEDALRDGFKKIVATSLNAILSDTDAGEHEDRSYFFYVHHQAVARLDIMLWRYNFVGKGFSDRYENALGYLISTSVVDVGVLGMDEFVYIISEHADDSDEKKLGYIEIMKGVYENTRKQKQGQRSLQMSAPLRSHWTHPLE